MWPERGGRPVARFYDLCVGQRGFRLQAFSHFALVISALQLHSEATASSNHPMRAAGPTDNSALYHDEH
jgi:hypothetical protein